MRNLEHDLVQYLKEFVVDERRLLFEEKIKQRTKHITVVLENIFQGRKCIWRCSRLLPPKVSRVKEKYSCFQKKSFIKISIFK